MISLYKAENTRKGTNDEYLTIELRGLSTDSKPTEFNGKKVDNGSIFIEINTGKLFLYDLDSTTWKEI